MLSLNCILNSDSYNYPSIRWMAYTQTQYRNVTSVILYWCILCFALNEKAQVLYSANAVTHVKLCKETDILQMLLKSIQWVDTLRAYSYRFTMPSHAKTFRVIALNTIHTWNKNIYTHTWNLSRFLPDTTSWNALQSWLPFHPHFVNALRTVSPVSLQFLGPLQPCCQDDSW